MSRISIIREKIEEKRKERAWKKRIEKQAYEEAYPKEKIEVIKEKGRKKAAERARAPTFAQRIITMVPKQPGGKMPLFEQKVPTFGNMGMGIESVDMDFGLKGSEEMLFGKKPKKTKKPKINRRKRG